MQQRSGRQNQRRLARASAFCLLLTAGIVLPRAGYGQLTFGAPSAVIELNTPFGELARGISGDGLTIYLSSQRPIPPATTASTQSELWVSTRATTVDPWDQPTLIAELNSAAHEFNPTVTADNLTIVFDGPSNDLWIADRASTNDPWGAAQQLPDPTNGPHLESSAFLAADELTLLFASERPGGVGQDDLYMATRPAVDAPWTVSNLGNVVNTAENERGAYLSSDGRHLFFGSTRAGGYGNYDLYVSSRDEPNGPWQSPVNLGPQINTSFNENFPLFWDAGKTLFFRSHGLASPQGQPDIFQVRVIAEPSTGMLTLGGLTLVSGCISRHRRCK